MISRLATAYSKLLFCIRISANINTLFKLVINTKRLSWYKKNIKASDNYELAVAYLFTIRGIKHRCYLRTFQGDIDIFYEIFWRKIYELPHRQMQPYQLIIDIGANIGLAALYFATHCSPAQIICLEPDEDNYRLLQKNCAIYKNIKTMQAALMPDDGWCSIKRALFQYNNSVVIANSQQNNVRAISMPTLFNTFQIDNVDLLKIDIEGGEEAVFSSDTNWLDKVSQLLIEIHSLEKDNASFTALQRHQFSLALVNGNDFSESVYWATSNHMAEYT